MSLTYILLKKIPLALRIYKSAGAVISHIRLDDPQDIKHRYLRKKQKILEKVKKNIPPGAEDPRSRYDNWLSDKYIFYAEMYEFEAKRKWGRPDLRNSFECAWSYMISADFYLLALHQEKASFNYHFAGNMFRKLNAINRAIDAYKASASLAKEDDIWKNRNLNRIKGLKREIGED